MGEAKRRAGADHPSGPLTSGTGGLVMSGFCYGQNSQTPQWRFCYAQVCIRDAATTRRIIGEIGHEASGAHIPAARNNIVRNFLDHPLQPDWLWLHDTDATFSFDVLDWLLASAEPVTKPIMGALAFGVRHAKDDNGQEIYSEVRAPRLQLYPMVYLLNEDGQHCIWEDYPKNKVVPVVGTACHCLLIHRRVLADEKWLEDGHPLPWFRMSVYRGQEMSEDHFFCMKAQSLGYPVHVNTAIKTGHVKTFVADENAYLAQRMVEQQWQHSETPMPM